MDAFDSNSNRSDIMSSYIILATAIMIASLAIGNTEAGYERLDKYLTKQVANDEVGPNIEAASIWLKEQREKKLSFMSSTPVTDLEKFTALQQVIDDIKCDDTAHEIMRDNERAVGLSTLFAEGKVTRRVDKVILEIFKNHAERCQQVYPNTYREKKQQLSSQQIGRVETIAKLILEHERYVKPKDFPFYTSENLFNHYVKRPFSVDRCLGENLNQAAIVANSKRSINKDRVKEMMMNHLIEPCKLFVSLLGPGLYSPAGFDAKFRHKIDGSNREFYLLWSYFMICKALINHEREVFLDVVMSTNMRAL